MLRYIAFNYPASGRCDYLYIYRQEKTLNPLNRSHKQIKPFRTFTLPIIGKHIKPIQPHYTTTTLTSSNLKLGDIHRRISSSTNSKRQHITTTLYLYGFNFTANDADDQRWLPINHQCVN